MVVDVDVGVVREDMLGKDKLICVSEVASMMDIYRRRKGWIGVLGYVIYAGYAGARS